MNFAEWILTLHGEEEENPQGKKLRGSWEHLVLSGYQSSVKEVSNTWIQNSSFIL